MLGSFYQTESKKSCVVSWLIMFNCHLDKNFMENLLTFFIPSKSLPFIKNAFAHAFSWLISDGIGDMYTEGQNIIHQFLIKMVIEQDQSKQRTGLLLYTRNHFCPISWGSQRDFVIETLYEGKKSVQWRKPLFSCHEKRERMRQPAP